MIGADHFCERYDRFEVILRQRGGLARVALGITNDPILALSLVIALLRGELAEAERIERQEAA